MYIEDRLAKVEADIASIRTNISILATTSKETVDALNDMMGNADALEKFLAAMRAALTEPPPAESTVAQDDGTEKPPIAEAQNAGGAQAMPAVGAEGDGLPLGHMMQRSEEVVASGEGETSPPADGPEIEVESFEVLTEDEYLRRQDELSPVVPADQDMAVRAAESEERAAGSASSTDEAPPLPAPASDVEWSVEDRMLNGPRAVLMIPAPHAKIMARLRKSPATTAQISKDTGLAGKVVPNMLERLATTVRDTGLKLVQRGAVWHVEGR